MLFRPKGAMSIQIYQMDALQIYFYNIEEGERRRPVINTNKSFEYVCDGKEGSLCFDGYYYVEDHAPPYPEDAGKERWECDRHSEWLPKKLRMHVIRSESEPYKKEEGTSYFHVLEDNTYIVEVYKRVKHENTDKYSKEEDDDGEEMNICFFPTDKQTIYFRVLETLTPSSETDACS